jgi:fatty-acyl-CoA synthase
VLVPAREFKTSDYAGMIEEVRGNCPESRSMVLIGSGDWEALAAVEQERCMEQVTICYGMTETSPVSTQTRMDDSLDLRVSTGPSGRGQTRQADAAAADR